MSDIVNLQNKLLQAAGPSGFERNCAKTIAEMAKPFVDDIFSDGLGSLICHKSGRGKRIMTAAHMDVIGFMASEVRKDGYIDIIPIGAHPAARLIGFQIRFLNGVKGVLFGENFSAIQDKPFSATGIRDIYVDIGARSREEALSLVRPGDVAVFDGAAQLIAGNKLLSPYLDDLIGCVVQLLAMERQARTDNDCYYVFTAQEELRARGAGPAAAMVKPDAALAIDICHTGDCPAYSNKIAEKLGGGAAIKLFDLSAICDPRLTAHIRALAEASGIAWQNEIAYTGGTDAGALQLSGTGVSVSGLSVPTRYSHTPVEMCDLSDIDSCASLLAAVMAASPEFLNID